MDSNGILNVNAKEESTGKSKNIKIKNEKGRLGKGEIDRMIADAEKFREEDEKHKRRVGSRNALESYLFSIRTALREHVGDNLTEKEIEPIDDLVSEQIYWLEAHQEKDAEVYDEKLKTMQKLVVPIMAKIHKKDANGPKIEEIVN